MPPTGQTAVRVLLSSGDTRTVDGADAARLEGAFFMVTCRDQVVLTLWAQTVIGAEILRNGVRTSYVEGKGVTR
jgi:hypothetical protein